MTHARQQGIALQALVGTVIMLSMLILAISLVAISYLNNRDTLVSQVERSAVMAAKAVDMGILHITGPVENALQLLELDPLATTQTFTARMERLPVLVRTLAVNKLISAVYYGYENGDFFPAQAAVQRAHRKRFICPA